MQLERKTFKLKIEPDSVKASDDGKTASFEGYASTFGNEDSYGDVVDPGAFTKTIQEADGTLPMLWQHDTDEVIGIYPAMAENDHGLKVAGLISLETQRGREAYALLKMGAVKAMSIGFTTMKDVVDAGVRRLKEIRLWEISLVTFPANTAALITSVKEDGALRSVIEKLSARIDALEARLAEAGPEEKDAPEWDAVLVELRKLTEPQTHSAGAKDDGEPDESHYLSLVREMRSTVERGLAAEAA